VNKAPSPGRRLIAAVFVAALCVLAASCSSEDKPYVARPGTDVDPGSGLPLEIISTKDGSEMVLVKGGTFLKGDPQDITSTAEVPAFYIDKYEVTNKRYRRFVAAAGHRPPTFPAREAALLRWAGGTYPSGRAGYPVVLVTYEDALAYADWAGKRLPSQLQWEYAARGPDARVYPWGNSKLPPEACNTADRLAGIELLGNGMWQEWYNTWSKRDPEKRNADVLRPVGSFPRDRSPFGCLDMAGSVREWCVKRSVENGVAKLDTDWESNGTALHQHTQVTCGGSWLTDLGQARAWEHSKTESAPYYDVGFRCVIPADDPDIQALAAK
jgi:formylglycine-generating enzyme required for sulfatase activity